MTGPEFADLADDSAQPEPAPQPKQRRWPRFDHPDGWRALAGVIVIVVIAMLAVAGILAILRWWAP